MTYQSVFRRYELKYLIDEKEKNVLLDAMAPYMLLDNYGRTVIRNIYFDTDSFRLIRRSIEKPCYKEKIRLRSYCRAKGDTPIFVELKKKYRHVVYKRRLSMTERMTTAWITGELGAPMHSQIANEIDYFIKYYSPLSPSVFLSYEREAYYAPSDCNLRITFDDNILARCEDISLSRDVYGTPLLNSGEVLMEVKCIGGMPLWLTDVLSKNRIYKTSFSKYGTAYKNIIFNGGIKLPNMEESIYEYI